MFEHVKWCLIVFLDCWNKWHGMALCLVECGLKSGLLETCNSSGNERGQSTEYTFSRLSSENLPHQLVVSVDYFSVFLEIGGQSTDIHGQSTI